MQGRTATFSTFSDAQFDEAPFEVQFTGSRKPMTICWYWIVKLKARFLSGDYAEALAAADKAKPVLGAAVGQIQQLDYFYYASLAVSALYEAAWTDQRQAWRELLRGHQEQLREWAESYPPTFADKHTLVLAESPASKNGTSTHWVCMSRRSIWRARTASFKTKAWPMNWRRSTTWRTVSKRPATPISATRGTAMTVGAPTEKKATRRTVSAPARGTNSRPFGHD